FSWDPTGNQANGGTVIGPNNQLLEDSTFRYAYDRDGNQIRKTEKATGNYTVYSYDFRNRLIAVEERTASGIILSHVDYTYDLFNRRIAETANGTVMRFVSNGNQIWADFNGAGTVIARYLTGSRIDEMLARFRPGEGTSWYLTDRVSSVRDIVNA